MSANKESKGHFCRFGFHWWNKLRIHENGVGFERATEGETGGKKIRSGKTPFSVIPHTSARSYPCV